jgi:hypothetical protein
MRLLSHVAPRRFAVVLGRSVRMPIWAWMRRWACLVLGVTPTWVAVARAEQVDSMIPAAKSRVPSPAAGSTSGHAEPANPASPVSEPGPVPPAKAVAVPSAPASPPVLVGGASPTRQQLPTTRAQVLVRGDWPHASLELRDLLGRGVWQAVCALPCGQSLEVEGMEARVTAPNMSPTNAFRIEPGSGVARLQVTGGASLLRSSGMVALATGLVVGLGGASLYGYGRFEDRKTLVTLGAVTLIVLPLLALGRSTVKDAHGRTIAAHELSTRF